MYHNDLDGRKDDSRVGVLKLRDDPLADHLSFLLHVLCCIRCAWLLAIPCYGGKDGDATPFRALAEGDQELGKGGRV